jgi:hypothetical protein
MPRPQAIIDGLTKLMRLIDRGEAVGHKKYRLNNAWYKRNQQEVLERTEPIFTEPAQVTPPSHAPAGAEVPAGMEGATAFRPEDQEHRS